MDAYIWELSIDWLWRGSSKKKIQVDVEKNTRIFLLADKEAMYVPEVLVYYIDSVSLTDSWGELIVYRQDWQVMDSVVYKNSKDNMSLYFGNTIDGFRTFSITYFPSPWIDEQYFSHIPISNDFSGQDKNYKSLYNERKSKYTQLKKDIKKFWLSVKTTGEVYDTKKSQNKETILSFDIGSWSVFEIYWVQPNPEGKDTWNEKIKIKNISQQTQNLSSYSLYNWSTKKSLEDKTVQPWEIVTLVGDFWLVNKARCVALWFDDSYVSPFCYTDMSDDERAVESLPFTQQPIESTNKLLKTLSLVLGEDNACIFVDGAQILCKSLPYSATKNTELKTASKTISSLEKKLNKITLSTQKKETKQEKKIDKLSLQLAELTSTYKQNKLTLAQYKKEVSFHIAFTYYLFDFFEEERPALFYNSTLVAYRTLFWSDKEHLASALWFSSSDIELYIRAVAHRHLSLETQDVHNPISELVKETKTYIDTFKETLTTKISI